MRQMGWRHDWRKPSGLYAWERLARVNGFLVDNLIWHIVARLRGERGQTMTEYALILALVAVAAVATYALLGNSIINVITSVTTAL
jgi:Flp pilus assembly pilin Flp